MTGARWTLGTTCPQVVADDSRAKGKTARRGLRVLWKFTDVRFCIAGNLCIFAKCPLPASYESSMRSSVIRMLS